MIATQRIDVQPGTAPSRSGGESALESLRPPGLAAKAGEIRGPDRANSSLLVPTPAPVERGEPFQLDCEGSQDRSGLAMR